MPTYQVTIGERTLKVALRHEGNSVFARVDDGEERAVAMTPAREPLHALLIGGRRAEVMAASRGEMVELNIGGIAYAAEVQDEAHARLAKMVGARGGAHARRELKAPMPGLVVRVLAEVGQAVEAHQPLAVLQAMKMENELALPRGGTVSAVHVESGQTVEAGQVLVTLEE